MSSVLYDAQGPRAKRRNVLFTVVFLVAAAAVLWWVITSLNDKDQLAWEKWKPFFSSTEAWTTYLWPGLQNTLKAAALSMVIAMPLGAVLGIARLSDHRWVRVPVSIVVEFFRAIPVLILMIFGVALYSEYTNVSSDDRPLYAVVTGLVLYNASVLAEIVRAGILSLPKGQSEAAMAIGLRKNQVMRFILLPQAVTVMLPAIVSQLVVIVKDTALGGAVLTFSELLASVGPMSGYYGANTIASFTIVALIYIAINFSLTTFASWLEGRLRRGKKSTGAVLPPAAVGGAESTGAGGAGGGIGL
ncbi:amino acid ABC transporter permease [Streptomyces avermitilis]|uniref:Glutamate ABC transporter permease n=1 Tax=Streptomyces avermitilis (strain ATCC 31267 / DSM 46492 / JCM 5070 / NBRC 14893 / NCIMB 12804 / NRRL 8165 / MA-4680) TaxID=227882 RepID=Q82KB6_STRAW|nr:MULTISPECIES: amino acid ABC transporter permease [Streptomyces]KUN50497.1 amino acid ABC transporter permease [Streptomyces avermitilis]MYS98093.1 ABC transporter permease subunit [Streptomyces sp. SID5469]OOV33483.1 amino acid ABC transporter permease [Streptomyces avermitilis]BAC70198.1 putative glutamate ABC transporter permease [Streptomyces avermitilis MA-4680 = NBRC 14893]